MCQHELVPIISNYINPNYKPLQKKFMVPALRLLGNIVTGNDAET